MYCRYCGKELADDSLFCSSCGLPVDGTPVKKNSNAFLIIFISFLIFLLVSLCVFVFILSKYSGTGFIKPNETYSDFETGSHNIETENNDLATSTTSSFSSIFNDSFPGETHQFENLVFTFPDGCRYYILGDSKKDYDYYSHTIYINNENLSISFSTFSDEDAYYFASDYLCNQMIESLYDSLIENYLEDGYIQEEPVEINVAGEIVNVPVVSKKSGETGTAIYPFVFTDSYYIYCLELKIEDFVNTDYNPLLEFFMSAKYVGPEKKY